MELSLEVLRELSYFFKHYAGMVDLFLNIVISVFYSLLGKSPIKGGSYFTIFSPMILQMNSCYMHVYYKKEVA